MRANVERAREILRWARRSSQYNSEISGRLEQIERELDLALGDEPSVRESDEVRAHVPRPVPEPEVEGFDLADEDE